jgi:hypothetical protein
MSVIVAILALWMAGLTWYVVRMAMAPVPVQDVQAAIQEMAVSRVREAAKTSPGREALRARLAARKGTT